MWKNNKASQSDGPQYTPPGVNPAANPSANIHVLKEREVGYSAPTISSPSLVSQERAVSRLGAGLHIKGEISGTDDLIIDGSVEGLIQMEGRKLTVGSGAKIIADIHAAEIIVYGNVQGNLCARDRIEIKMAGEVLGELTTSRIMIEDGAYFKGSIEIDRHAATVATVAPAAPAASGQPDRLVRNEVAGRAAVPMGGSPTLHPPTFDGKAN